MNESLSIDEAVTEFAAVVRAELDDLPVQEVEELTEGLEADLMDRLDDRGDNLGDPRAYSEELRSAAGLPPRGEVPRRAPLRLRMRLRRDAIADSVRTSRLGNSILDFAIALRPVWWMLRGWVVFAALSFVVGSRPVPSNIAAWLLFVGCVVLSVQWGRGPWLAWRWLPPAKAVVSAVAAVVIVPLAAATWAAALPAPVYEYDPMAQLEGLYLNGEQVENVFPFDCSGTLLTDVQLFDENGEPLATVAEDLPFISASPTDGTESQAFLVPSAKSNGNSGWNVFPLNQVDSVEGERIDTATQRPVNPPFASAQPLAGEDATCAFPKGTSLSPSPAPEQPEG